MNPSIGTLYSPVGEGHRDCQRLRRPGLAGRRVDRGHPATVPALSSNMLPLPGPRRGGGGNIGEPWVAGCNNGRWILDLPALQESQTHGEEVPGHPSGSRALSAEPWRRRRDGGRRDGGSRGDRGGAEGGNGAGAEGEILGGEERKNSVQGLFSVGDRFS